MKILLGNNYEFELFQTEEAQKVQSLAKIMKGEVYSWKTEGIRNWLEKGFSVVDSLGLVIVAQGFPNKIELPDDDPDHTK